MAQECAYAWRRAIFVRHGTRCLRCGYDLQTGTQHMDPHHVVYRQHLYDRDLWEWDVRNGIPICRDCHDAHHNTRQLPLCLIPDECLDYAFEVLGAYAHDYLARYYIVGPDTRLDSRLAAAA